MSNIFYVGERTLGAMAAGRLRLIADIRQTVDSSRVGRAKRECFRMKGHALMRSGWLPIMIALLLGCASSAEPERAALSRSMAADFILVGRFVSSEDIEVFHPMGKELTHVTDAWRILTFETSAEPRARVRLAGPNWICPPEILDGRIYVITLQKIAPLVTMETRSRGKLIGSRSHAVARLMLTACTPVDAATSVGFVPPE